MGWVGGEEGQGWRGGGGRGLRNLCSSCVTFCSCIISPEPLPQSPPNPRPLPISIPPPHPSNPLRAFSQYCTSTPPPTPANPPVPFTSLPPPTAPPIPTLPSPPSPPSYLFLSFHPRRTLPSTLHCLFLSHHHPPSSPLLPPYHPTALLHPRLSRSPPRTHAHTPYYTQRL